MIGRAAILCWGFELGKLEAELGGKAVYVPTLGLVRASRGEIYCSHRV